jgi:hypothetical protein
MPKLFGDWIAFYQGTARWQSSGVCRKYCPGSKKMLHPRDGVASPEFFFQ